MTDYDAYFLNSPASAIPLDTLEITHPDFTQPYYIVRNAEGGITAQLEDGTPIDFRYYPLRLRPTGSRDDLEQSIAVDLGDLGEVIPIELDAVADGDGFGIKPTVKYRVYRSDDLSEPLYGPVALEVQVFNSNREGSTFEAKAPSLNVNRTGELYHLDRFPMLRGFL